MYFNDNVARPEFSPSPTSIKAWAGAWKDDTMVITSFKACTATNGQSLNNNDCTCGSSDCTTLTGLYCYKDGNQCSADVIPVCDIVDGSSLNAGACTCGTSECDATKGLFCLSSSSQCSQEILCNIPTTGDHTLQRSTLCTMMSQVTVAAGKTLKVSSVDGSGEMAIITGGLTTRFFLVQGDLTLTDLILEKGKQNYGGGFYVQGSATTNALVRLVGTIVRLCEATIAGGAFSLEGSGGSATLLLEDSTLESNKAETNGGAVRASSGGKVEVVEGTTSYVKNNLAMTKSGGGIYLQNEGSSLTVSGVDTKLVVDGNTAQQRGGGVSAYTASTVTVSSGAHLDVTNNKALTLYGGGIYLQNEGSSLTVSGVDTKLVVDGNTALQRGGGVSAYSASTVTVSSGAHLDVTNNKALTAHGGGFYLANEGTRLDVDGEGTQLIVRGNEAKKNGGGLALRSGSVVRVAAPSTFQSNTAIEGRGGGGAYDDNDGKDDGGSSCVRLSLFVKIDGDKNVGGDGNEISGIVGEALQISTIPNSPLSSINKRDEVANKETTWCIPCGKYELVAGTKFTITYLPKQSYVQLSVQRGTGTDDDDLVLVNTTEVRTTTTTYTEFRIPCAAQAVTLAYARFEANHAALDGGAIATPDNYKNALFDLKNISFISNVATQGKGGAIRASGIQTAVQVTDSTFRGNQASSGGAVSVDSSAGLQMFDVSGYDNIATSGDGGFLFARFASPILLSDVNIQRSSASSKGSGGGGVAVYSSQIAMERVRVQDCQAGRKGGGALLLDGEAEAHVFDAVLDSNEAATASGGHVRVAASSLSFRAKVRC